MLVLRSISQEVGPDSYVSNTMPAASPARVGYTGQVSMDQQARGQQGPVQLSTTNLYIKGLPADTTDASLKTLCTRFGHILSTKAVLDPSNFKCKGFGFIDFETAECAQAALEALRQMGYQVGMAKKQEQAETNVFFKNLPEDFTKEDLERVAKECGTVSSVHIMKQNGRSMGVGFARMASRTDCEKIINKFNNAKLNGSVEPLLVKYADQPNRQKNQQVRALTGQELQGAMALAAGHPPYLYPGPPPQAPLSLGAPAAYTDNGMATMTMAAAQGVSQMPAMPTLGAVMTMPNMTPMHHAQYPTFTAANYGYLSMAPAAAAAYPSLQAQYGAAELLQHPTAAAPTAPLYMPSAAGVQQMMPGMQAAMDPTVGGMAQWQ